MLKGGNTAFVAWQFISFILVSLADICVYTNTYARENGFHAGLERTFINVSVSATYLFLRAFLRAL